MTTEPATTLQAQAGGRVRCRQIVEDDLDGLADLQARGFPNSPRHSWIAGFARWRTMAPVEGVPRFGYVLDDGQRPVGVLLLISSRRGDRIMANLSSWYVEPQWRTHSTLLVQMATRQKDVTYLNASPAPHTWRILQAQGFQPYNFGRSGVFALPGRGRVSEDIPAGLPEAQLLADHRAWGWTALTVEKEGGVFPFVFKPRRLDRLAIGRRKPAVMDLMYCRSIDDFRRCAPALARYFLARGVVGFLVDGDADGMLSHYVEGKEPRYFKGPHRPVLGDLAYTEKVVFG
jgi:hypothetical protein